MVSIILLSHNLGEVTKACVESIRRNVSIPYEIIVVDNHSDEETLAILDSLEGIRLIKSNVNLGFPAGCNRGLQDAGGDIIWFLNNDTIVPPGALEIMVRLLLSEESIGIVGPVTNKINGKQQIPVDYTYAPGQVVTEWSGIDAFAEKTAKEYAGQTWRMIRLVGFSMLMRRSSLERLGGFDERMGIGTFEDDSISLKFVADGYKLLVARDAFIHHIGSASFKAAGGYPPGGERNQFTASCSAGMTIPDEAVLNEALLSYISTKARRVLHVECGAGAYGLLAAENNIYAEGLESSPAKARIARNHYSEISLYKPGEEFEFTGENFDTVIIEKQYDSRDALALIHSVQAALTDDARIILQVPKITAIHGGCYEAYAESWDQNGCTVKTGNFEHLLFLQEMSRMGFALTEFERKEAKRGFFNRNSFARFQESLLQKAIPGQLPTPESRLEFYQEAVYVFEKY